METKTLVEVVRRAQKGDSKAQQELYIDSSKSVYFLALKILKNPNDAEDITQDVFITVFEKVSELKQPAAYYKWLNQITANKCMSFLRKKKPVLTDEQDILDILELDEDEETPEKLYDDEETRRIILEIIDELPDAQRLCVMYRYFNQLSIEEIAEITATNEHTVRSRLMLARNKIRAAILEKEEKEGIRLHVLIPITPILMRALEDFQMPQGVSEQMWQKIAEGAGIAAAGGGAAAAASEAAKAGTKEAAKQGVKAKVIGGVAGVAAVAVIATVILWQKPEEPVQVTAPPSSAPVVSQTPDSTPEPPEGEAIVWQEPVIEAAVKTALQMYDPTYNGGDITPQMTNRFSIISLEFDGSAFKIFVDSAETVVETSTGEINIADLAHLKGITQFTLKGEMTVSGIDVITGYGRLAYLEVDSCLNLTELPSLSECYNLGQVFLINLPLTSLPDMRHVYDIYIENCAIIDFTDIAKMENAVNLQLVNLPISDISFLVGMPTLQRLHLVDMPISDISPLATLTELHTVNISDTDISDVSVFTDMTNLTSLTLKNNNITDISPLSGMTQLHVLYLEGNPITDKSPLNSLTDTQIYID